jgi:putative ABC transport system ATP-binding protein
MVFQSFNLIPSRTAQENIILALIFGGTPRRYRKKRAGELLDMVGLKDRTKHKPTELSGGEAQRVAIARALANDPEIILADEPTGNLDSSTSIEIVDILVQLNRKEGKTVIMVTHDEEVAGKVSDRLIRLKDGMVV